MQIAKEQLEILLKVMSLIQREAEYDYSFNHSVVNVNDSVLSFSGSDIKDMKKLVREANKELLSCRQYKI